MKLPVAIFFILCSTNRIIGHDGFNGTLQDWGFVNVRPGCDMFWWLYYTTARVIDPYEKPLVIWMEGGPGLSGTGYGNFYQIGPIDVYGNPRNYSWVDDYNVLYIDHPVGTGFSYANDTSDLVTNNHEAVSDIFTCILEFLEQIPEFQTVPTYLACESYAGKVCPELASIWHKAENTTAINSSLKGVLLISPWVSPIESIETWTPYLLALGMIDSNGRDIIDEAVTVVRTAIDEERWYDATVGWESVQAVVINVTGALEFGNVLTRQPYTTNYSASIITNLDLLMNGPVKTALGIQTEWNMDQSLVLAAMMEDFMRPVIDYVEFLLNETNLKVFVAAAQLDVIVDNIGTVQWIQNLKWSHIEDWQNADRVPVYIDGTIEGYVKQHKNLWLYWIHRSGHLIASGNPVATRHMLRQLTNNSD